MSKNLKESMRITSQEMKTINKDRNYRLTEMIQYEEQEKKKNWIKINSIRDFWNTIKRYIGDSQKQIRKDKIFEEIMELEDMNWHIYTTIYKMDN